MRVTTVAPEARRVPPRCPCGRPVPPGRDITVAVVAYYGHGVTGPIVAVAFHHPGGLRCRWERANVHAKRWSHSLVRPA